MVWLNYSPCFFFSVKNSGINEIEYGKKLSVPLKRLVFPKLHARKIQMPSKISWVPRQRPNCIYFILSCDLVNTISQGIQDMQSKAKKINMNIFKKKQVERWNAHIWFQSLHEVFFQLSTDIFKKLTAAKKREQWL